MAKKVLARDWTIEIHDGTAYQTIGGLNSFTLSPAKDSAETTDFDSGGFAEHLPVERSYTLSFDGFYLEDGTGVRDAGQAEVEDAAELVGEDGLVYMHLESPDGGKEKWFEGSIDLSDIGGGQSDTTSWGFELEVTGEPMTTDPA